MNFRLSPHWWLAFDAGRFATELRLVWQPSHATPIAGRKVHAVTRTLRDTAQGFRLGGSVLLDDGTFLGLRWWWTTAHAIKRHERIKTMDQWCAELVEERTGVTDIMRGSP